MLRFCNLTYKTPCYDIVTLKNTPADRADHKQKQSGEQEQ